MANPFPWVSADGARVMLFVDGENLAIRFGALLNDRGMKQHAEAVYEPNVFVWSPDLSGLYGPPKGRPRLQRPFPAARPAPGQRSA
jgi:hypothetical protein